MAVMFSSLYEIVRTSTGNDDPDLGQEVMSDDRINVLLRSAVRTITSYDESLPHMDYRLNVSNPDAPFYEFFNKGDVTFSLEVAHEVGLCIAYIAAHKYYVGIGNKQGVVETMTLILNESKSYSGEAIYELNDGNIGRYKIARAQQLARQFFNFT